MANYSTLLKTWGDTGSEYPAGYSYLEGEQPVDAWDNYITYNVIQDLDHLIGLTNKRIETDRGAAGSEPTSPEASHLFHDQDNEVLRLWDSTSAGWKRLLADDDIPDLTSGASDSGTQVLSSVTDFNFGDNLTVVDDGDGTVSISAADNVDTHTGVSEDGTQMYASVDDIDFTGHLNVIDDGDGTVTIDPTHDHDSRYVNETDHDKAAHDALNIDADTLDGNHASAFVRLDSGGAAIPVYATVGNVPALPEGAVVYVQDEDKLYVEDGN